MQFKLSNWVKPSNKKLKLIADVVLYSFPLVDTLIVTTFGGGSGRLWVSFFLGLAVILFKTFTKFTAEEDTTVQ